MSKKWIGGKGWRMKLRYGLFEITDEDFNVLYSKMCGCAYE